MTDKESPNLEVVRQQPSSSRIALNVYAINGKVYLAVTGIARIVEDGVTEDPLQIPLDAGQVESLLVSFRKAALVAIEQKVFSA